MGRWAPCAHLAEAQMVKVCSWSQGRGVAELASRLHPHQSCPQGGVGRRACPGVRRARPHPVLKGVWPWPPCLLCFHLRKGVGASSVPMHSVPGAEPSPGPPALPPSQMPIPPICRRLASNSGPLPPWKGFWCDLGRTKNNFHQQGRNYMVGIPGRHWRM